MWNPVIIKLLTVLEAADELPAGRDLISGGALAAFVAVAVWRRWLAVPRATVLAMAVLFAAFIVSPLRLHGATFFDVRFMIMLGYVLFAGVAENPLLPRRASHDRLDRVLVVIAGRLGLLAAVWQQQGADVAQVRRVIAPCRQADACSSRR